MALQWALLIISMAGKKDSPIGVFDSGLGGLTVVKELVKLLPRENLVYFGDTARVPYGSKSKETIIQYSLDNAKVLLEKGVKMIVVACNSSSGYAIKQLKESFDIPILGVVNPGARAACEKTFNQRIGVIATSATIASEAYPKAIHRLNDSVQVFTQACPLFVPLVEEGWPNKKVTEDIAREYLKDMRKQNIDTLILGCTHYPILKATLKRVMGPKVHLIDSAKEVAMVVSEKLRALDLLRESKSKAQQKYIVSDKPQAFDRIAKQFLGFSLKSQIRSW